MSKDRRGTDDIPERSYREREKSRRVTERGKHGGGWQSIQLRFLSVLSAMALSLLGGFLCRSKVTL